MTLEPTLHDIARGTTGCGNDDDRTDFKRAADEFYANEYDLLVTAADIALASYIDANGGSIGSDPFTIEHAHDALCYGTLDYADELRCGF